MAGYGFIVFVFSSDAPDIDYQNGYIRRISNLIVSFFFTVVFFNLICEMYFGKDKIDSFSLLLPLFFLISVICGFLFSKVLFSMIPNHRGPLHSIPASFIYAIFIGFFSWSLGERFSIEEKSLLNSIFLLLCSFTGYNLHLFLDKKIRKKKR